jgi:Protein of unknown function (DUF433)
MLDRRAYGLCSCSARHATQELRGEVNEVRTTDGKPQSDGRPTLHPGTAYPHRYRGGMIADDMREDEILEAFPDLEHEDIREALRYAAEAVRERELAVVTAV